jgi:hypothetical protein
MAGKPREGRTMAARKTKVSQINPFPYTFGANIGGTMTACFSGVDGVLGHAQSTSVWSPWFLKSGG